MRAILTYAKASWQDNRLTPEEWAALKTSGKFEYNQIPALEVDGKMKTQSLACEVFLARRFGLMGSSEDEEYQILNFLAAREDLYAKIGPLMSEKDETKKAEMFKKAVTEEIPFLLGVYESKYASNGGKYYAGDKFSVADIQICTLFLTFRIQYKAFFGGLLDKFAPNLNALVDRLIENELSDFYKNVYNHTSTF
jgi:glutathione S-transferase